MATPATDFTGLLVDWGHGNRTALEALIPRVYQELHRLAHIYMTGERPGRGLQTTALVNEAYLRLVDCQRVQWRDRTHFFAVSAQLMRRILVDFARSRNYLKRGGAAHAVELDDVIGAKPSNTVDLLVVDEALDRLADFDQRKARVVELKFFVGLSVEEIAEVLQVSPQTILRDWKLARAWLLHELEGH